MSDRARDEASAVERTLESLKAELAAATALRHKTSGALAPAPEASVQCSAAAYILAESLHAHLRGLTATARMAGYQERCEEAIPVIMAALAWWKSYDAEMYLTIGLTDRTAMRKIAESIELPWRDDMPIEEFMRECSLSLHRRRGRAHR